MSSDEYFTAEEDAWEDEGEVVDLGVLAEYGFCVWTSGDGTKWYLPFYNPLEDLDFWGGERGRIERTMCNDNPHDQFASRNAHKREYQKRSLAYGTIGKT